MAPAPKSFNPTESGYVEVKDRITAFMEKYPDGSLQSEIVEFTDTIVIMKGLAYRTPGDERPGVGHSQMPIPGLTPYTKNSEVENAETSAWGRAIAALGFEVKRSIASAEEVANKQGPSDPSPTKVVKPAEEDADPDAATAAQKRKLMTWGKKVLGNEAAVRVFVNNTVHKNQSKDLTKDDMDKLFAELEETEKIMNVLHTTAKDAE